MWRNRSLHTTVPRRCQATHSGGSWRGSTRGRGRSRGGRRNYGKGRDNLHLQEAGTSRQNDHSSEGASAWIATTAHIAQNSEVKKSGTCEITWLLDSGCSDHIINDDSYFEKCIELEAPVNIYLGDNRSIKATKIGTVMTYFATFGKQNKVKIKNVYFAKNMNMNLISLGKLTDNNNIIISEGKVARIIDSNDKLIAVAHKENSIYKLKSILKQEFKYVNSAGQNKMSLKEKWHKMLGHVNFGYLNILSKQELLTGIPSETEFMKCKTCIENKMSNLPFNNNRSKAREILEIVHTDVCGLFKTKGFNGENYFVLFIDDYSKIAKVYCIKGKDEGKGKDDF